MYAARIKGLPLVYPKIIVAWIVVFLKILVGANETLDIHEA